MIGMEMGDEKVSDFQINGQLFKILFHLFQTLLAIHTRIDKQIAIRSSYEVAIDGP